MKQNLDTLLKQALSPDMEADERLNQRLLCQAEERRIMKSKFKSIPKMAVTAACVCILGTLTVFAAWKYLSPAAVAERVADTKLSKAFQGEDAVAVNETQEYGGYSEGLEDLQVYTLTVNGDGTFTFAIYEPVLDGNQ